MKAWHTCSGRLAQQQRQPFDFIMLKRTLLATLATAVTSAELLDIDIDIPGLLASLAPAPPGDSRFTTFTPPGHNDG